MRGHVNMHVVTRLMRRGITMKHPGFASAYEREATRHEEEAARSSFLRWWTRLAPRQPIPDQHQGEVACGTWTNEEAERLPALHDILRRAQMRGKPSRITVTWRVGTQNLTVRVSHGSQHEHLLSVPL